MVKVKVIETGKTDVLKFVVDGCDALPDLMEGCDFEEIWDEELGDVLLIPQDEYDWWINTIELLNEEKSLKEELEEEQGEEAVNKAFWEAQSYGDIDLDDCTRRSIAVLKEALGRED